MAFHLSSAASRRALLATALFAALLVPATVSFAANPSVSTGTIVGTVTCGADEATPAPSARIAVQGMSVTTSPDTGGKFTLSDVPAGQMLNIDAQTDASGTVSATRYNVSVSAGSVTDIGNLDLAVCPQPQPAAPAFEPNQWSPDQQGNGY